MGIRKSVGKNKKSPRAAATTAVKGEETARWVARAASKSRGAARGARAGRGGRQEVAGNEPDAE
jgi:hypothetical protein